jgi:hypothetical protein
MQKLKVVFFIVAIFILMVFLWFVQPFSFLKTDFNHQVRIYIKENNTNNGLITEADIHNVPEPVKKYLIYCGYIGKPKMNYMRIICHNVDFLTGKNSKKLKIDYTQYNFESKPIRLAFIDSSLLGIPFQGFDSYHEGIGGMKGVVGKVFTLFNQTGVEMDKSSLVTFLSESLILPSVALKDYIEWESIDDTHAKATLSYYGISVSGLFTFNENGEMISFDTDDREAIDINGNKQKVKWSIVCSKYIEKNGIREPSVLQAIWHYPEGDMIYFDAQGAISIEYY